jgi:hypothetical protein
MQSFRATQVAAPTQRLERALYFDALPAAVLEEARPELYRMGERLLREAHQRLNTAESPEGSQRRLRLGVYYL